MSFITFSEIKFSIKSSHIYLLLAFRSLRFGWDYLDHLFAGGMSKLTKEEMNNVTKERMMCHKKPP